VSLVVTSPSLAVQSAVLAAFNALEDAQRPVARTSVTVGVTPWDDCCAGQLYARIDRLFRSDRFPAEGLYTGQECATPNAALIVVGLVRCYPSMDEGGNAPPAMDESSAALGLYDDAFLIWRTLQTEQWWPDAVYVQGQGFLSMGGCCAVETTVFTELV